jgi:hypothetical protein
MLMLEEYYRGKIDVSNCFSIFLHIKCFTIIIVVYSYLKNYNNLKQQYLKNYTSSASVKNNLKKIVKKKWRCLT